MRAMFGFCIVVVFLAVMGFTATMGPIAQMIGLFAVVMVGYTGWAVVNKEGK